MNPRSLAAAALVAASAALAAPVEAPPARDAEGTAPKASAPSRRIRFNGTPLGGAHLETLARLEGRHGRIADGSYWYDPRSGASGRWGGPTLAFLPVGLELGGPLPAEASGGGRGLVTGVFVNGRELHPVDVAGLEELLGPVSPGRWWVDGEGNYGPEGGPRAGNLLVIARQLRDRGQRGRHAWSRRVDGLRGPGSLAADGTPACVPASGRPPCARD